MMSKKKPLRGAGFSITIPTEPLASAAKNVPLMAVQVQDEGVKILEYDVKEGAEHRVSSGRYDESSHAASRPGP